MSVLYEVLSMICLGYAQSTHLFNSTNTISVSAMFKILLNAVRERQKWKLDHTVSSQDRAMKTYSLNTCKRIEYKDNYEEGRQGWKRAHNFKSQEQMTDGKVVGSPQVTLAESQKASSTSRGSRGCLATIRLISLSLCWSAFPPHKPGNVFTRGRSKHLHVGNAVCHWRYAYHNHHIGLSSGPNQIPNPKTWAASSSSTYPPDKQKQKDSLLGNLIS